MAGPTRRPFTKAVACAGVALLLALVALFGFLGPPASAEGAGEAFGRLLLTVSLPALVTGWLARRSPRIWPFWKIAACFLLLFAAVVVIQALGRSR